MHWFRVELHGSGIRFAFDDDDDPAIGFYTPRDVLAADPLLAQQVSVAMVLDEWRGEGAYARGNRGEVPTLAVEACWPLGFWRGHFGRRRRAGYSFYSRED